MTMRARILPSLLFMAVLAGCNTTGAGVKPGVGTQAGGTAGAPAGNQIGSGKGKTTTTVGGAVLGALAGSEIGGKLDDNDRKAIAQAEHQALETAGPNRPVSWQNPGSGHRGQVSAGPAYFVNESNCRDYAHTVYVDSQPEILRGTACRTPEGRWQNVS